MKKIILIGILSVFMVYGIAKADKVRINFSQVSRPAGLEQLANAIDTELDANRTATNLNSTLADDIRDTLKGDYLLSYPWIGRDLSAPATVYNYTQDIVINGVMYQVPAQATVLALITAVTQNKVQAYALDVGSNLTIDVTTTAAAAGYDSAALAIAAITALAADHVRLGYFTVTKSDGDFTPASTNLNATNVTTGYTKTSAYISGMSSAASGTAVTEQVQRGK